MTTLTRRAVCAMFASFPVALKTFAASLDKDAASAQPIDASRMMALAEILKK